MSSLCTAWTDFIVSRIAQKQLRGNTTGRKQQKNSSTPFGCYCEAFIHSRLRRAEAV